MLQTLYNNTLVLAMACAAVTLNWSTVVTVKVETLIAQNDLYQEIRTCHPNKPMQEQQWLRECSPGIYQAIRYHR